MAEKTVPIRKQQQACKTERRAWVRYAKDVEVWCQPWNATDEEELGPAWLGSIRDISPDGIGLIMSRRFEPETKLIIELEERSQILRHLVAHVVHATLETKGRWIIGCTFNRMLNPEELQTFLAE
jgi:hypothetical protein